MDQSIKKEKPISEEEAAKILVEVPHVHVTLSGAKSHSRGFADPYGGKTKVHGQGDQHDFSRGVDIKTTDTYVRNGWDNFFPYDVQNAVLRSTLQKRAYESITSLATGKLVFLNSDGSTASDARTQQIMERYKMLGIDMRMIAKMNKSNYLYGGTPMILKFGSNGIGMELSKVEFSDYKNFRLSAPVYKNGMRKYEKAFYHRTWGYYYGRPCRSKTQTVGAIDWIKYTEKSENYKDSIVYYPMYNEDNDLNEDINRAQVMFVQNMDLLKDHYPSAFWFTGETFNYIRASYLLSTFDVDDIENNFMTAGLLYVYSKKYMDPKSGEFRKKLNSDTEYIKRTNIGAANSGSVTIIPMAYDHNGKEVAGEGYMRYVPIESNNKRERHEILDKRIKQAILAGNSAIYPELFGVRDSGAALSEGSEKLATGIKLLNLFAIVPLKKLIDDPQYGFLNVVNDMLGIQERAAITPNLRAFFSLSPDLIKHFMHPDNFYDFYTDFGFIRPTAEQIASGLIPAYNQGGLNANM